MFIDAPGGVGLIAIGIGLLVAGTIIAAIIAGLIGLIILTVRHLRRK